MDMSQGEPVIFGVSDFVASLNQTMEFAYGSVLVTGELANFRVSKGKWLYFDLKDELASVRCFGTVYMLPGPLEDGMLVQVRAVPRLHPQFGFSLNLSNIQPAGEGSIKKAASLLEAKLAAEGLFDESRKRPLPYPPQRIGLVASGESAAFADFIKILQARWSGLDIMHIDVQVQGEVAPRQIVTAIEHLNGLAEPPEVIIITRGGGSAEDLQAFSTEQVTRAVAASRVPTLVAIGHETDISLAELAADRRASTPSNAAELLVPDKTATLRQLAAVRSGLQQSIRQYLQDSRQQLQRSGWELEQLLVQRVRQFGERLMTQKSLLEVLSPQSVLKRGYTLIRRDGVIIRSSQQLRMRDTIQVQFADGVTTAVVEGTE